MKHQQHEFVMQSIRMRLSAHFKTILLQGYMQRSCKLASIISTCPWSKHTTYIIQSKDFFFLSKFR